MSRTDSAWIYWTALAVAVVIGGALILLGRGGPDCSSSSVQATVLDLVKKNTDFGSSTYDLDKIAKTGEDPQAGTISCSATAWVIYKDMPFVSAPITYTISRAADGKTTVHVKGISGLRMPVLPQLPQLPQQ